MKRRVFAIDQDILSDGNYRLNKTIKYTSPRYGKTSTVPAGRISDGATGAMDIVSRGWWIHDELCKRGKWDDGTKLTNWQCSQVLQDVLTEEGRRLQGHRWFWATWLLGGDKARKNGMLWLCLCACLLFSGCAIANINTKTVDGKVTECSGSYYSMFKDVDSMSLSACGSKGNSTGSKVNTALMQEFLKTLLAAP